MYLKKINTAFMHMPNLEAIQWLKNVKSSSKCIPYNA